MMRATASPPCGSVFDLAVKEQRISQNESQTLFICFAHLDQRGVDAVLR